MNEEQAKGVHSLGKETGSILQTSQETAAADKALMIKHIITKVATHCRLTEKDPTGIFCPTWYKLAYMNQSDEALSVTCEKIEGF